MSVQIKDLPKKLKEKACKRMFQQREFVDENYPISVAFNWGDTKEGHTFWQVIDGQTKLNTLNKVSDEELVTKDKFFSLDYRSILVKDAEEVKPDSVVESIVNQFRDRSSVGIKKYGTTLDRNDLSKLDWIEHAKQEAMDLILYLEKLKQTL